MYGFLFMMALALLAIGFYMCSTCSDCAGLCGLHTKTCERKKPLRRGPWVVLKMAACAEPGETGYKTYEIQQFINLMAWEMLHAGVGGRGYVIRMCAAMTSRLQVALGQAIPDKIHVQLIERHVIGTEFVDLSTLNYEVTATDWPQYTKKIAKGIKEA